MSQKKVTLSLYNVGFVPSPEPHTLRPHLQVVCREFRKIPSDPLSKSWISNGQRFDLVLPAYAIPPSQIRSLDESLDTLTRTKFDQLLAELAYGQHELIVILLQEATRHVKKVNE